MRMLYPNPLSLENTGETPFPDYSKTTTTLILQSTPFCNIACSYCYLGDKDNKTKMSLESLKNNIRALNSSGMLADNVNISWHAGEPLALPVEYYEEAVNFIKSELKSNIYFQLQTNATLIDDKWQRFISNGDLHIGISLDGPKEIHDKNRVRRNGQGTFEATMRGLKLVQDTGVDFGIISVADEESLKNPEKLFDFFSSLNIRNVSINIPEKEGENKIGLRSTRPVEDLIKSFIQFFYARRNIPLSVRITQIERMRKLLLGNQESMTLCENIPLSILTVSTHGELFTFSPELLGFAHENLGSFSIGALDRKVVLNNKKLISFTQEIESGVDLCRKTCAYFRVCGGGHPASKFFELGHFAGTGHTSCHINTKLFADTISELLLSDLDFRTSPVN